MDKNLNLDVNGINIFFYDFANNFITAFPIKDAARGILTYKNLKKNRKFVLFVGGFKSQIHKRTEEQIRQAYATYPDSYLIIPDHSQYTNVEPGMIKGYERAVTHVHYIGKALGQMLVEIVKGGIRPKNIHCVGHSLGGQIFAHTGETFTSITGQKIGRITALDPAGPCFSRSLIQNQIRSGVADYVEVFHCNSGMLGSSSILADVDYLVNKKGESQPSCNTPFIPGIYDSKKAATCNHRFCIDVWTASVKHKNLFKAMSCDSYKKFKKRQCAKDDTLAGAWGPATAKGIYYLSTTDYDLDKLK